MDVVGVAALAAGVARLVAMATAADDRVRVPCPAGVAHPGAMATAAVMATAVATVGAAHLVATVSVVVETSAVSAAQWVLAAPVAAPLVPGAMAASGALPIAAGNRRPVYHSYRFTR